MTEIQETLVQILGSLKTISFMFSLFTGMFFTFAIWMKK